MKNLKLVLFFAIGFLFAGVQFAAAQVKDKVEKKVEAVKNTTDDVRQETSELNIEDDKRVYRRKVTETKKEAKGEIKALKEKSKGPKGKVTMKELDSDEIEVDYLDEEDLDDDDH